MFVWFSESCFEGVFVLFLLCEFILSYILFRKFFGILNDFSLFRFFRLLFLFVFFNNLFGLYCRLIINRKWLRKIIAKEEIRALIFAGYFVAEWSKFANRLWSFLIFLIFILVCILDLVCILENDIGNLTFTILENIVENDIAKLA